MENNTDKTSFTSRRRRCGKNKPNIVDPTIPGAVGSHESLYQEGRDSISDSRLIIDDVINNIRGKSC